MGETLIKFSYLILSYLILSKVKCRGGGGGRGGGGRITIAKYHTMTSGLVRSVRLTGVVQGL